MSEKRYFHPGQFFKLESLISTVLGLGVIFVTEYLLPSMDINTTLYDFIPELITPTLFTLTLTVILLASTNAKNIIASLLLGISASLMFYNPSYMIDELTSLDVGWGAVLIMYVTFAVFAGFFACQKMTGKNGLRTIGVVFGAQGLIGAGAGLFLFLNESYRPIWNNTDIDIAIGDLTFAELTGTFPLMSTIMLSISLIYLLVFVFVLARINYTISTDSKKFEIIGQIIIFLGLAGGLIACIFLGKAINQDTVQDTIGARDLAFLNNVFTKSYEGNLRLLELFSVFYILPIVGFIVGVGLFLIILQRAEGTTEDFSFNQEGGFLITTAPAIMITFAFSYTWYVMGAFDFYLKMETWYFLFTEYTILVLGNFILAFLLFKIVSLIKSIVKKE